MMNDDESDLCKSVDYSSGRCSVEKHHGNSHDVIEQPGVQDTRCIDRSISHEQSAKEHKDACQ